MADKAMGWRTPGQRPRSLSGENDTQGTAKPPPGPLDRLGCPGLGLSLPGHALALGTREHFALPITAEFRAVVRIREHGSLH